MTVSQAQPNRPPERIEALLRRLHWTVLRPLANRLGGEERSLFRGPGVEFDELREYQPGDDVRLIDWNVTAREGTPFVRQAFVTRSLDAWMLMDLSASVDWGTANCLKRDRALEFVAVAGQLFERSRHHLGALFFADRPLGFVPPGVGREHLLRTLDVLRSEPRQLRRGTTDLRAALIRMETVLKRRSLILLVTDFLVSPGWQSVLARLAQSHEVVAVRLRDPREFLLPDVGSIVLEDPETGKQVFVNTTDHELRERFQTAALQQAEQIRQNLAALGIDCLDLDTAEELLPPMVRFLDARKRTAGLMNRGRQSQAPR